MRKIIAILVMLSLAGCTTVDEKPGDNNGDFGDKLVAKIDDAKAYIYVESNDGLDLSEILKESSDRDLDEWISWIDAKTLLNEKIKINIDSDDARKLEKTLNEAYSSNHEIRKETADKFKNSQGGGLTWITLYVGGFYQTEQAISLSVVSDTYRFYSEGDKTITNYVFSIKDGKLLTDSEVLALAGTTIDGLKEAIVSDFEKLPSSETQKVLIKDSDLIDKEAILDNLDKEYYLIKPEQFLFLSDKGIGVVFQSYSGPTDSFVDSQIYEVLFSSLK